MRRALVLDANQRSALAIVRSLGRHGIQVVAADHVSRPVGAASRYAVASQSYADPAAEPERFIADVKDAARRFNVGSIFPATDVTTMLLVDRANELTPAVVASPGAHSYEQLTDKRQLVSLAESLGVPVPDTRIATDASGILSAAGEFGYPLVLKPARSRYLRKGAIVSTGVRIIDRPDQLGRCVADLAWLADIPCLVQRFIPGHGAGIFALYGRHGPAAWFAHRRIREKPPSGGVSVLSESAPLDPRMQRIAQQLLSAANWFGVAMVEFRVATDGTPYLMEVNGRFWGSLQLAIDAGVDFPWMLHQLVSGEVPASSSSYRLGRRLRWVMGDLDHLILQLRDTNLGHSRKLGVAGRFLRSFFEYNCRQEVFRWSDPGPGLREMRQWLGDLLQ
jgi:predicted ATP-grasp superfamily ATP-dependent carboligase